MDRLERIEAAEAIRQTDARHFRLMDTKQCDTLRHVFDVTWPTDTCDQGRPA